MPIQNRKSYSMSPGGKSSPRPSSPRPSSPKPAYRPPVRVNTGPKGSFSSPVNARKETGSPGFQQPQVGNPGYRRPFYRRRGSIISFIVFMVLCLICLVIAAAVWIVPSLLNGTFRLF
jgi:hypothetical protein